jgi:hypothetical protein
MEVLARARRHPSGKATLAVRAQGIDEESDEGGAREAAANEAIYRISGPEGPIASAMRGGRLKFVAGNAKSNAISNVLDVCGRAEFRVATRMSPPRADLNAVLIVE